MPPASTERLAQIALIVLVAGVLVLVGINLMPPPAQPTGPSDDPTTAGTPPTSPEGPLLEPAKRVGTRSLSVRVHIASSGVDEPAADAAVSVFFVPAPMAPRQMLARGTTDADGLVTLEVDRFPVEIIAKRTGMLGAALTLESPPRGIEAVELELARNLGLARQLGFAGTPSFIIGNRVYEGAVGKELLQEAISEARGS